MKAVWISWQQPTFVFSWTFVFPWILIEVLALCRLCNNIALLSRFYLIAHQNEFLISLCHLMLSISEKSIKNTTEQCCFGKKAMFGSWAKCPQIEVLALCWLCNNIALPSCFVIIANRYQYLMSLCHLMLSIIEKSKKKYYRTVLFWKESYVWFLSKMPLNLGASALSTM